MTFVGATILELGLILLMLGAINESRTACFGWVIEEAMESHGPVLRLIHVGCTHDHQEKGRLLPRSRKNLRESSKSVECPPTGNHQRHVTFRKSGSGIALPNF